MVPHKIFDVAQIQKTDQTPISMRSGKEVDVSVTRIRERGFFKTSIAIEQAHMLPYGEEKVLLNLLSWAYVRFRAWHFAISIAHEVVMFHRHQADCRDPANQHHRVDNYQHRNPPFYLRLENGTDRQAHLRGHSRGEEHNFRVDRSLL